MVELISDEELELLRPDKKHEWVNFILFEFETISWQKQPFMFQCRECNAHYTYKSCPNCNSTTFETDNQRTIHRGIYCTHCKKGFTNWACNNCGCDNDAYGSRYLLKYNAWCFVATAVYGSPSEPAVVILSQFRDDVLLKYSIGKLFVKLYYRLSPPIANYISTRDLLRKLIRLLLIEPIVKVVKIVMKRL